MGQFGILSFKAVPQVKPFTNQPSTNPINSTLSLQRGQAAQRSKRG